MFQLSDFHAKELGIRTSQLYRFFLSGSTEWTRGALVKGKEGREGSGARSSAHRLSRPPTRSRQQHGRSETEEYSSDSESESEDVSTGFQKVSLRSGLPFCGNERGG